MIISLKIMSVQSIRKQGKPLDIEKLAQEIGVPQKPIKEQSQSKQK